MSLALLGLAAVDPIGIGVMPALLTQRQPYCRACVFLGGSFISLLVMGLVFAKGFGNIVLHFEESHLWLVPAVEAGAGLVLLGIAVMVFVQLHNHTAPTDPPERLQQWLALGNWQLFGAGAALVAIQSAIDIVFVVAMIRIGQFKLSELHLLGAIATYAIGALLIQLAIVGAFWLAPARLKAKTLKHTRLVLTTYANEALIVVSLGLGGILLFLSIHSW